MATTMTELTDRARELGYTGGVTAAYGVKDRTKAIAWYTEILGFKFQYDVPEIGWCELETPVPGVNVGFSDVETPEVKGGPTLTWGVTDIERVVADLQGKGVVFDGEIREYPGMVKLAMFHDPDGNHLMLYQGLS